MKVRIVLNMASNPQSAKDLPASMIEKEIDIPTIHGGMSLEFIGGPSGPDTVRIITGEIPDGTHITWTEGYDQYPARLEAEVVTNCRVEKQEIEWMLQNGWKLWRG